MPQPSEAPSAPSVAAPKRLEIDGAWHPVSPKFVPSQLVQYVLFFLVVAAATVVVGIFGEQGWAWIPGGIVMAMLIFAMVILPRQAKALGFMLRENDLVFRRGIMWQRMVAVPYGRMQLVDIIQGPLDRAFGISRLKLVTAAATTGVDIPALTQEDAEALRDTLIRVAETRRTGL